MRAQVSEYSSQVLSALGFCWAKTLEQDSQPVSGAATKITVLMNGKASRAKQQPFVFHQSYSCSLCSGQVLVECNKWVDSHGMLKSVRQTDECHKADSKSPLQGGNVPYVSLLSDAQGAGQDT